MNFSTMNNAKRVLAIKGLTSFYSLSRIFNFFKKNCPKKLETNKKKVFVNFFTYGVPISQKHEVNGFGRLESGVRCPPRVNVVRSINTLKTHSLTNKEMCLLLIRLQVPLFSRMPSHKICPVINLNRKFSTISGYNENKNNKSEIMNSSELLNKIYKTPKNVLHNAYNVVAQEFQNQDFKLYPVYNIMNKNKNSIWCCTYHIKWPEPVKFEATGQTKKEASHKAATYALHWLQKNKKITKDGYPVFFDKDIVKEVMNEERSKLYLDHNTLDRMKAIVNIYQNEFEPLVTEQFHNNKEHVQSFSDTEDTSLNLEKTRKKIFAPSKYFVKEKTILPISDYKDKFINLLKENRSIIVKGEPGCGKSTRIPQYILEAWIKSSLNQDEPCQIAVTQPRRIAAISLAKRVSEERDENCGHIVGYQVRLNSKFNPQTGRILYCTTGIMLNYLQSDINLRNFTHVLLDEAHERDVNTDLLMNLLKKSMELNQQLKIIIMSATIDTNLFRDYFHGAPVLHIPGFTFPVKSYFLDDLTNLNLSKSYKLSTDNKANPYVAHEEVAKLIIYIHKTKKEGAILCFLPGWEDIARVEKLLPTSHDMTILCLHSRLQDTDQRKIFEQIPPGIRKVILSTNIAETSVTIDDVVYVIDTGIHKESRFDYEKGVTCVDNCWISQSSVNQRKGRAGRVQPGQCFHLYTKSKCESFAQFSDPGILKTALTKIVLDSKVYSNNMDAIEFMSQLPTPPKKSATRKAIRELKNLQLLDDSENLTPLGKTLSYFQLEPKFAKILVNAVVYKCVTPVVDIVTIFAADTEIFSSSLRDKESIREIKSKSGVHSDHLALMRLFEAWLELIEEKSPAAAERYCIDVNLVHHKLQTVNKLRKLHFDYLYDGLYQIQPIADDYSDNDELVKAILYSGVGTLLRPRNCEIVKGRFKRKNIFLTDHNQRASITSDSVNFKRKFCPSDFLVYFNETTSNMRRTALIRECSLLAPISVILFSDKDLTLKQVEGKENQVILAVNDRNIEFICAMEDALEMQKCKEALNSIYTYFIYQMTEGGKCNVEINKIWDKILNHLNMILLQNSIN